jgi:hypothetical protein
MLEAADLNVNLTARDNDHDEVRKNGTGRASATRKKDVKCLQNIGG